MPVDGDKKSKNKVTISEMVLIINHAPSNSTVKHQIRRCERSGLRLWYSRSIKVAENNNGSLKGAKFQVIRVANNHMIGEFGNK